MIDSTNPKLYAYFGHHKCASTYSINMCYELCNTLGLKPIEEKIAFHEQPERIKPQGKSSFLISQTSTQDKVDLLQSDFKGFHVIRDPRDICVSGYFSHLKTHFIEGWPELGAYRKELQKLSKEEGLLREFDYSDFWLQHISDWDYQQEHIIEVKMEDLTEDPYNQWHRIFSFLGLINEASSENDSIPLSYKLKSSGNRFLKYKNIPEKLRSNKSGIHKAYLHWLTTEKYTFNKLSAGRKVGQENTDSHYRKGTRGDWKNHFLPEHKKAFKAKYGDLLIRLGYESDLDW